MENNNKRIAQNTLMLYFRQILILLVSLYTVRVVLEVLGVEDYGIYNVVGGIVSFFTFLSGTMASATQRFFSFALGEKDFEKLKKTFIVNCIIYSAIAVIALILLETVGLWFVSEKLRVPSERISAVFWIYHFAVLTFICTIIATPFMAIIIAHEDMQIYAYVSIIEAILKLVVVFLLVYLPWDKLELYGMLLFAVSIIIASTYLIICIKKYKECQFRKFYWDKGLLREIVGFTGWTLFGQITTVARNQAVTILLNQAFNPVVVAARAIATTIASQINVFSNNFNVGLYPPIIKSYAADNKQEMFSLIFRGSKITFFLMWVFALPFFLEMNTILALWLKNPPPHTILFTRLALIESLINALTLPIATAARAPGKMKFYELTLGCIQIAIFVSSWIVLLLGGAAYAVFVIAIIANLIMFIVRLLIVRRLIGLLLRPYFSQVVVPVFIVGFSSALFSSAIHYFLPTSFMFACMSVMLSILGSCSAMYFMGLDKLEREKIKDLVISRIYRLA
ncbi:lipopolysaccharide biosynthesis protein [Runella zeae]|uniref:lipopolysaccharide biosynthesis protein n=1 Tax=Runella zeae TaxID=94255 RepID=UPI0023577EAE|nr:oligosaccharide flippase family protein [Runella zeae]